MQCDNCSTHPASSEEMLSSPCRFLCPAQAKWAPSPLAFWKPSPRYPLSGTQFSGPLCLMNITSPLNSKPEIKPNLFFFVFCLALPQKFSEDAGPINEFRGFRFFLSCWTQIVAFYHNWELKFARRTYPRTWMFCFCPERYKQCLLICLGTGLQGNLSRKARVLADSSALILPTECVRHSVMSWPKSVCFHFWLSPWLVRGQNQY